MKTIRYCAFLATAPAPVWVTFFPPEATPPELELLELPLLCPDELTPPPVSAQPWITISPIAARTAIGARNLLELR
ncbi:MAG: hypothetical protein U0359_40515 [Byssovorax sp.]